MSEGKTVTLTEDEFKALALEAWANAARQTVERMTELAPDECADIVAEVGRQCLAELEPTR
jgi:hypothetical protein